jgi:hypothetical protein
MQNGISLRSNQTFVSSIRRAARHVGHDTTRSCRRRSGCRPVVCEALDDTSHQAVERSGPASIEWPDVRVDGGQPDVVRRLTLRSYRAPMSDDMRRRVGSRQSASPVHGARCRR